MLTNDYNDNNNDSLTSDVLLERLATAKQYVKEQGADAAEFSVSVEHGFSATARNADVETLEHHNDHSLSVTVYSDQQSGSASSSDLSLSAIKSSIDKALIFAKHSQEDPCSGLPEHEMLAFKYPELSIYHPWQLTPREAIDLAIQCEALALSHDQRISQSEGVSVSSFESCYIVANTLGFDALVKSSTHSISCSLIAEQDGKMQRDGEYTIARNPRDLQSIDILSATAAKNTVGRLGSRKIKTQRCPVLFEHSAAKSLIGAFVSANSGSKIYRNSSFLADKIGTKIFPSNINIHQNPHLPGMMGSSPFDHEGVLTRDHSYVSNGYLESHILSTYSAKKLGLKTTGNAGGVFNLSIQNDKSQSFNDIIRQMHTGLLVTDLIGQGINLVTGDYSRGASGYWVENGEIQYPVEEITIAGQLQDMFKSIVSIGNDVDKRGSIHTGSILIDSMSIAGH